MASSYPPPFEGTSEVKEGFLCPLCLKDLQSISQLQGHYEEEHSGDDHHVRGQLRSLVLKAKKAKDKLLKRDGDDRTDTGTYVSFCCVDPYMWEPQELGATRSHLDFFKKHRAARIDHYVIEVNKLIIRLEKLTSFDRVNSDAAKIRAIEKSVVSWVSDSDVPFCPDCGNKFNIRNRRHHCRLCGSIMCRKCMEFVPLPLAQKLISGTREALCVPGSPPQSQSPPAGGGSGGGGMGSRRGSISSLSSVTSMLEEKDDEKIRCCHHCMDTLLKRQQKLEEKDHMPDVVKLYERLRMCMEKVDERAPEYIKMAESLNAGETTYNLDTAAGLRLEVQKYYELIDALSKKILTLRAKDDPPPHPKALQLQRMIRYTATLFVQEKLLGLMSLPTKDKYEELKEKRKQEQENRLRQESEKNRPPPSTNGELPQAPRAPRMTKAGGWLPSADSVHTRDELQDPLLQQIENIQSFLRQAREAQRTDEVAILEENLRQLQDEYDQQQTSLAIVLSQKLAEEESMQQGELHRLETREREEREHWGPAVGSTQPSITWERTLDISGTGGFQGEEDAEAEELTPKAERSPSSVRAFPALTSQEESPPRLRSLGGHVTPPGGEGQTSASLNPFDDEDSTPIEEDPSNPFFEDIKREHKEVTNGKKEYNPFDEDEEVEEDKQAESVPRNPFEEEDDDDADTGNPFLEASGNSPEVSTNPFDGDDDDEVLPDLDMIEEELLLQQIDNIRAYIFDAKLSGRLDEVELLSENLRELQHTLQEQKKKKH
ncbi:rabenosyn-5 [Plectropomus leopardus]|uniref:rabenosyn-5 n=1 Tax=Plectropomus leopardus TaxID=160734 RepID=UPI001C4ABE5E|nr:rabenosyn-5 [Plectropomus leopardus]